MVLKVRDPDTPTVNYLMTNVHRTSTTSKVSTSCLVLSQQIRDPFRQGYVIRSRYKYKYRTFRGAPENPIFFGVLRFFYNNISK